MSYHDNPPLHPDRMSKFSPEACGCADCVEREVPCFQDCDPGEGACLECHLAYEALKDAAFDANSAKGIY